MTRYDVMQKWSDGFVAGIRPAAIHPHEDEHWQAGYLAGYKMRVEKNRLLDEYLISTGREPQAKIGIAAGETT